jgi:hypothetical protein
VVEAFKDLREGGQNESFVANDVWLKASGCNHNQMSQKTHQTTTKIL